MRVWRLHYFLHWSIVKGRAERSCQSMLDVSSKTFKDVFLCIFSAFISPFLSPELQFSVVVPFLRLSLELPAFSIAEISEGYAKRTWKNKTVLLLDLEISLDQFVFIELMFCEISPVALRLMWERYLPSLMFPCFSPVKFVFNITRFYIVPQMMGWFTKLQALVELDQMNLFALTELYFPFHRMI